LRVLFVPQPTGAHYGRIVSGKPPFEELALLLVESGEPEALQVFLQTKLQVREALLWLSPWGGGRRMLLKPSPGVGGYMYVCTVESVCVHMA
jgi:hypothetical protein